MLFALVPVSALTDLGTGEREQHNVGIPRRLWGTQAEPGPSFYKQRQRPHVSSGTHSCLSLRSSLLLLKKECVHPCT